MCARLTPKNEPAWDQAIVIGSSIAGLTAARVLADHFAKVIVIERDRLPEKSEFRRAAPQSRHAHTLPLRGQEILEHLFPGLSAELVANGGIAIEGGSEMAFFIAGKWHQVRHRAALVSTTSSRPLLERTIYRRVSALPNVRIIQEVEAKSLQVDARGERVTGLRLRRRLGLYSVEMILNADLVVDASGRASRAPQWLASLGYTPPKETTVDAFSGYSSRLYRRPSQVEGSWKTLYVRPSPPDSSRGGFILPIEGDRWHVTLIGMVRDYPPTDPAGFLEFARSLPAPEFYEAIKEAEPLTKPYGYRNTENRVRHYDQLPRYLEGFLVTGDAAYALNPVYAQGMTAALMGSQAMEKSLQAQRSRIDLTGLAQSFQVELSQAVADPWQMAIRHDRRWPIAEIAKQLDPTPHYRREPVLTMPISTVTA